MTRDQLHACTKKTLADVARKKGIPGWHGMTKDELVLALARSRSPINPRRLKRVKSTRRVKPAAKHTLNGKVAAHAKPGTNGKAKKPAPASRPQPARQARSAARHPLQTAAARNTGTDTPEELVESSKYDVGVPTKDLSAKVPKDLPAGYGKDRIVVMVRDPYWLHCYWELTRHAIQRAEAALGQEWHTSRPVLR